VPVTRTQGPPPARRSVAAAFSRMPVSERLIKDSPAGPRIRLPARRHHASLSHCRRLPGRVRVAALRLSDTGNHDDSLRTPLYDSDESYFFEIILFHLGSLWPFLSESPYGLPGVTGRLFVAKFTGRLVPIMMLTVRRCQRLRVRSLHCMPVIF
jgi:hypothetical protein